MLGRESKGFVAGGWRVMVHHTGDWLEELREEKCVFIDAQKFSSLIWNNTVTPVNHTATELERLFSCCLATNYDARR